MLVCPSLAYADTSDRFAMGGWIEKFQPAIDQANSSGELFRIRGHCQSNCTLFLGVRNASSAARNCCFMPATGAARTGTSSTQAPPPDAERHNPTAAIRHR